MGRGQGRGRMGRGQGKKGAGQGGKGVCIETYLFGPGTLRQHAVAVAAFSVQLPCVGNEPVSRGQQSVDGVARGRMDVE